MVNCDNVNCKLRRMSTTNVIREFRVLKRRFVEDILKELGPVFFRRAHRMRYYNFETLLVDELCPYIVPASAQKEGSHPSRFNPNGPILPEVRLAWCAMQWFYAASSSAYDLMTTYGTGHTNTIKNLLVCCRCQPSIRIRSSRLNTQKIMTSKDILHKDSKTSRMHHWSCWHLILAADAHFASCHTTRGSSNCQQSENWHRKRQIQDAL